MGLLFGDGENFFLGGSGADHDDLISVLDAAAFMKHARMINTTLALTTKVSCILARR